MHFPWLYEPQLIDVSDVVTELEKKYGKVALLRLRGGPRQGHLAGRAAVPRTLRADLPRGPLQEGQPQGAGHLGGAVHGRQGAEEDGATRSGSPSARTTTPSPRPAPSCGRSAAWRSTRTARRSRSTAPSTASMLEWYQKMYRDCMEPEVLSWSDASNNESMQQGKAGWIHNPVSAYIVAKQRKLVTADRINHHRSLAGPGGRHETDAPRSIGIWKFSKNHRAGQGVDPLPARQARGRTTSTSCRATPSTCRPIEKLQDHPVLKTDPKYAALKGRRACSTTPTAGRRRPPTRSSSSPTRSSCPT